MDAQTNLPDMDTQSDLSESMCANETGLKDACSNNLLMTADFCGMSTSELDNSLDALSTENCTDSLDSGVHEDRTNQTESTCSANCQPSIASNSVQLCCPHCTYTTTKRANFYKHKRLHSDNRHRYVCFLCSYRASTGSNLQRHLLVHADTKQFCCHICSQCFRQKVHLDRHITTKHKEKQVQCSLCSYSCSENGRDLVRHMSRRHLIDSMQSSLTEMLKFVCNKCNFRTATRRDLAQHLKLHSSSGTSEIKFFCTECSFVTDFASRLERHRRIHSNDRPFGCALCDYRATQKDHIARHLATRHQMPLDRTQHMRNGKLLAASSADVAGTGPDDVIGRRTHVTETVAATSDINSSTGTSSVASSTEVGDCTVMDTDLPVSDSDQSKRAVSRSTLQSEMDDSRKARSIAKKHFACQQCTLQFTKLISLYKHIQLQHSDCTATHLYGRSGAKLHACPICSFSSASRSQLLTHMRRHTRAAEAATSEIENGSKCLDAAR